MLPTIIKLNNDEKKCQSVLYNLLTSDESPLFINDCALDIKLKVSFWHRISYFILVKEGTTIFLLELFKLFDPLWAKVESIISSRGDRISSSKEVASKKTIRLTEKELNIPIIKENINILEREAKQLTKESDNSSIQFFILLFEEMLNQKLILLNVVNMLCLSLTT